MIETPHLARETNPRELRIPADAGHRSGRCRAGDVRQVKHRYRGLFPNGKEINAGQLRLSVRKTREVLRLKDGGVSDRQIGVAIGSAR